MILPPPEGMVELRAIWQEWVEKVTIEKKPHKFVRHFKKDMPESAKEAYREWRILHEEHQAELQKYRDMGFM